MFFAPGVLHLSQLHDCHRTNQGTGMSVARWVRRRGMESSCSCRHSTLRQWPSQAFPPENNVHKSSRHQRPCVLLSIGPTPQASACSLPPARKKCSLEWQPPDLLSGPAGSGHRALALGLGTSGGMGQGLVSSGGVQPAALFFHVPSLVTSSPRSRS